MVVLAASQQIAGIGIAARSDYVMHRATEFINPVPVQRIFNDGCHRTQVWKAAPHSLTCGQVRAM